MTGQRTNFDSGLNPWLPCQCAIRHVMGMARTAIPNSPRPFRWTACMRIRRR